MTDAEAVEIYGLIVVCFLLTLILVRLLVYVRKQAQQVEALRQQVDLINKAREKN